MQLDGTMWNLILYVMAVVVGLVLIWFYEPRDDTKHTSDDQVATTIPRKKRNDFQLSSLFAVLGLEVSDTDRFEAFTEHFSSFDEVSAGCRKAGLESSNLIIGVDFTASNEWQGRKSFSQNCLHKLVGNKVYNPYQKVMWILGHTLKPFDSDNYIPVFGFGDSETTDEDVFPFHEDEMPCAGFEKVLEEYNRVAKNVTLSGPTSFAPIITKAIQIVRRTRKYHILVIIADGQVNEEKPTIDAIVEASKYPISIIVVGVGDGPWDVMDEFDHRLPKRKFDNFRFVDYHKATFKAKNPDTAFALQALMEIPDQFKTIKALGYIDDVVCVSSDNASGTSSRHSTPKDSPTQSPSPKRHQGLRSRIGNPTFGTPV